MARKRIDPETIDLQGKKAQANKLERYAGQAREEAMPLLERAFFEGSPAVRLAAARSLGWLAPEQGERLLLSFADQQGPKPTVKARKELAKCALLIGRERCFELALGWAPPKGQWVGNMALSLEVSRRLARWLHPRLQGLEVTLAEELVRCVSLAEESYLEEEVVAFLWAVYDDERLAWEELRAPKGLLLLSLGLKGDKQILEQLRERGRREAVPNEITLRALIQGDPEQVYEDLGARFREDRRWRLAISKRLDEEADPRFVADVMALKEEDPDLAVTALVAIGSELARTSLVRWAESRTEMDVITQLLLHGIGVGGIREGVPVLLRWLDSPEGREVETLLVNALAMAGDRDVIPRLEELARQREGFAASILSHAIGTIERRFP